MYIKCKSLLIPLRPIFVIINPFKHQYISKEHRSYISNSLEKSKTSDESFSCVIKHKDDGHTKFIKLNSQRQDIIIKYWVSIGSIHREQG